MKYTKKPLTIEEQIVRLEQRGLHFANKEQAECYLKNIGYYRLRAFTYPFQDNTDPSADHRFLRNDIDFGDIIDLYIFDRRLRSLIFNELEKIEIAVRTQLSQVYSVQSQDPFDKTNEKRQIARNFGVGNENVFANWLHAFSDLRNCCAHRIIRWYNVMRQ